MARTTDEIIATMDEEQASQPELTELDSPSQTAIYKLWKYITAQTINLFEQLIDRKQAAIEEILARGRVFSAEWVQEQCFLFQYDATTPQVVQLVDYVPTYDPVDPTKRIVTRSCVRVVGGVATILVAKNEPPEKLVALEITAINNYFTNTGNGTNKGTGIGYVGQTLSCYSLDPDLLFLEAEIFYNGQYAATIEDDVILAIETYISNLPLDGNLRVVDLTDVIQGVAGFSDIFINNLSCRSAATAWGSGTDLILADTLVATEYETAAGYMIGETTAGETLADKLTFTAV